MDLMQLRAPFDPSHIEWRIGRAGEKNGKPWASVLAYLTSRAVMDRLDEVCGPENWKNEYDTGPGGGVICGLSIKVDGEWVTKWDGAENTDLEGVKGGLSGAMKRAAVQWGIGRYLYDLPDGWANIHDGGKRYQPKDNSGKNRWQAFKWDPPALPAWAIPSNAVDIQTGEVPDAHNEKVTEQVGELLAKIKPEHVSAMTDRDSNALYGLKEAVRTGDVGLLERGLPWLNKLVQGLDALDKLEGAA